MTEKIARRSIRSRANRREVAERINAAFEAGDVADICHAIADATSSAQHFGDRAPPFRDRTNKPLPRVRRRKSAPKFQQNTDSARRALNIEKAGLAPAFLFGCTAGLFPLSLVASRIHSPRM